MDKQLLEERIQYYKEKQDENKRGIKNNIPFAGFPSLNKRIPGIIPGFMYKVTSHSGMSKTQFTKAAFVYNAVLYSIQYNVAYTVFYVAVEESAQEFIDSYLIHLVFIRKGIKIDRFKLEGFGTDLLEEDELKAIEEVKEELALHLSYIELIDDKYKPTEIYNEIRLRAINYGEFVEYRLPNGEITEFFKSKIPFHKFLVICDHISLIEEEMDSESGTFLNHAKSIAKWHTRYARKIITKKWKWSVLNVQQQSLESEKQLFNSKGDTIVEKLFPTLDGVANNREVIRDDYIVLGLFSPNRYGIKNFRGYSIEQELGKQGNELKDNFRSVHILKSRFGSPNGILPLYFDGAVNYFCELPIPIPANDIALQSFYDNSTLSRL